MGENEALPIKDHRKSTNNAVADFLGYVADTLTLIDLTQSGSRALLGVRDLNLKVKEVSVGTHGGFSSESEERLARAEQVAELAEAEIRRDFPLLHNHALMGLWGALESMVDDVCLHWLMESPSRALGESFAGIRLIAGKFLPLSPLEQMQYLLEELKRNQGAEFRTGAGQFDETLRAIGLGGHLDPNIRNVMRISKALRNVIAHRGGVIDKRFNDDCADLGMTVGSQVSISSEQMRAIAYGLVAYADIVFERVRLARGESALKLELPPGVKGTEEFLRPFKNSANAPESNQPAI